MSYVIALDGGGTKLCASVYDIKNHQWLGIPFFIPSIKPSYDMDASASLVIDMVRHLIRHYDLPLSGIRGVGVSYAGLGGRSRSDAFSEKLVRSDMNMRWVCAGDADSACVGAFGDQDGACVIVGTGSVAWVRKTMAVEIFEEREGEKEGLGSGDWMGRTLISYLIKHFDQIENENLPDDIKNFRKQFETANMLSQWVISGKNRDIAALARYIVEGSKQESDVCLNILTQAGQHVSRLITFCEGYGVPVCMTGGLSSFIIPFLNCGMADRITHMEYASMEGVKRMIIEKINPLFWTPHA